MNFKEKNIESVINLSLGHFVITTVSPNIKISKTNQKEIITEFLKTKYFIWNYKLEPNGQNVILTDENEETKEYFNEKFFGFYDTQKLDFSDFKIISFSEFKTNIVNEILKQTDSEFLNKCQKIIDTNLSQKSYTYILNPPESKIPNIIKDWPIYVFFYAYLSIDEGNNLINLIEFGLD